jgi:hypothetical protein
LALVEVEILDQLLVYLLAMAVCLLKDERSVFLLMSNIREQARMPLPSRRFQIGIIELFSTWTLQYKGNIKWKPEGGYKT